MTVQLCVLNSKITAVKMPAVLDCVPEGPTHEKERILPLLCEIWTVLQVNSSEAQNKRVIDGCGDKRVV